MNLLRILGRTISGWLGLQVGPHRYDLGRPPAKVGADKPRVRAVPNGEPSPRQVREEAFRISAELRVLQDQLRSIRDPYDE